MEHKPILVSGISASLKPTVSVIMPTWKRDPKIISRAIDCLILQDLSDWELRICSDGCEEESIVNLVREKNDPRIRYYYLDGKTPGDYGNRVRKALLNECDGKFVLFFDDDNLILPNYLSKMLDAIKESGKDFAVCRIVHFGPLNVAETGNPPKILSGKPMKLYHIDTLQVLISTDAIKKVGWDQDSGYLADGKTFEKLGKEFEGVWINSVLGFHI
jgi:glycosyltransferase involved in cell wall biosynthesis